MAITALDNWEKFTYLGITKFHNKGYKGKGITIASRENTTSKHGNQVADVISQVCPEANILIKQDYRDPNKHEKNIDIYTTSMFFSSDKYEKNVQAAIDLAKKGTFLCCAVGNEASSSCTVLSKYAHWTSIGACNLSSGKITRMNYSSITNDIDFMSFTNLKTNKGIFTGTSCAAPCFAGMLALVQEFFKEKIGRKLTHEELIEFIKEHTQDLDIEGFDEKTGFGIFILPDPDEIDITKYGEIIEQPVSVIEPYIKMAIGSKEVYVNGEKQLLDVAPLMKDNRAFVPVRFISENLGYQVEWDNIKKEIKIFK